jgi:hypothetical protein
MMGALAIASALAGVGSGPVLEWDDAPRRIAVVVGLNRYGADEQLHDLAFAVNDATAMGDVLREDGYDVHMLLDQARPEDFWSTLRGATATLQGRDLFVLYFAGHAELAPGVGEHAFQLLFSDGTPLPVEELAAAITALPSQQRVVFLDTCYSERTQEVLRRYRGPPPIKAPDVGKFDAWIYSAAPRQSAQEDPALGHGVFTYYLLEALRGAADVDADGAVEVLEAYNWVGYRTAEHTGRAQVPRIEETRVGWSDLPITRPGGASKEATYAIIPWYRRILPTAQMLVDGVSRGPGSLEPGPHVIEIHDGEDLLLKRRVSLQGGEAVEWEHLLSMSSPRTLVGVGGGGVTDPRIAGSTFHAALWWQPRSAHRNRWAVGTAFALGTRTQTTLRATGRIAYLWSPTEEIALGPMLGAGVLSRRAGTGWMGTPAGAPGIHVEVREGPVFFALDAQALVLLPLGEALSAGSSLQATVGAVF